jgi:hypothetical protein
VAGLCEPGCDVLGIAVEEAAAARVGDDVDHLGQVDHHQSPAVDEQVVGGEVAVGVAGAGEGRHRRHELCPEAGELDRIRASLGQPGSAGSVRIADELKQDLRSHNLHGIGNGHAGVVELHEGVEFRARPLARDRLPPEGATVTAWCRS